MATLKPIRIKDYSLDWLIFEMGQVEKVINQRLNTNGPRDPKIRGLRIKHSALRREFLSRPPAVQEDSEEQELRRADQAAHDLDPDSAEAPDIERNQFNGNDRRTRD